MSRVCLELGLCYLGVVEITIMYERGPTVRRCEVPIVCIQQPYCQQLPARDYFYDNLPHKKCSLVEGAWPPSDEGAAALLYTVGERETEARSKQLLDVRATDILVLLDLNDPEDLKISVVSVSLLQREEILNERGLSGSGHGAWRPCPGRDS